MNTFASAIRADAARPNLAMSRTANGMRALASTANSLVDLFSSIGAMRGQNVIPAFEAAMIANPDVAIRIAQWARDVRGGSGERQLFRDILLYLERNYTALLVESNLLRNTAQIGRFDDLLIFQPNSLCEIAAFEIIKEALVAGNGLAAKWMPRKGDVAVRLRAFLGMSPKQYRKTLVGLTTVVETAMCAKNWNEINFSHVPSVAMSNYMTAFHKNAPEAFAAYKAALVRGDKSVKINAAAVYPYTIVEMIGGHHDLSGYSRGEGYFKRQNLVIAEAMWAALPDYMDDSNVIAVVDNSGSMGALVSGSSTSCGTVAASLGMYTASKSKGAFRDLSITFNDTAAFVQHKGNLIDRLRAVCSADWGSTNLNSVFNLILNHALQNRVPEDDMPKIILIMSDMQFNADRRFDDSAQQMIRRKYEAAGYAMPTVVYWNLNESGNKPVRFNERGVGLVSGFSPAIMRSILSAKNVSPESLMLEAVMIERYDW